MISSENSENIHTKSDGEQVDIYNINLHLSKKVIIFWKNTLGDMIKKTIDLQSKIQ